MKTLIFFSLIAASTSHAADYICSPKNPRAYDQSTYVLQVYKKKIKLGYFENDLKIGTPEINRNQNYLKKYLQYGGEISRLRGEGYLKAYLSTALVNSSQKGQMYLQWGGNGPLISTAYSCIKR